MEHFYKYFSANKLVLVPLLFSCNLFLGFSQVRLPETSGFGGYFLFGPGAFNVQSNLLATGPPLLEETGEKIISSIYNRPNGQGSSAFALSGEINYTFSKTKTQLFAGNGLEDILRLDVPIGFGVRQELKDGGMLMFRVLTTPLKLKFWEDPYIENESRIRTQLNFNGIRFRWSKILKSEFEFTATIRKYKFANEKSGEWLIEQGQLNEADQPLLNRNGFVYRLQLLYQFNLGQGNFIRPTVQYINDDHRGAAMANQGFALQLGYVKRSQKLILESRLIFGHRFVQAVHPVYQDKIDSYRYGAALSLFIPLKNFFGSTRWFVWLSGDYIQENNEVAFFDSNLYGILGGLMYRFN